jgi:predicted O-methyltransferase YrrM
MTTPLSTRVRLKIRKIARDLNPADREFRRHWPPIDAIEGWLLPEEGAWLFRAARSLPRMANIVEIGSFKGRSTCCLALGCRGTDRRVFAVDTFDGGPDLPKADLLPDFSSNLERMGLSRNVETMVGFSTQVSSKWDKPIHLLFIDGSHSYEDVLADFHGFFPFVVSGGIVAFHDVTEAWPGVLRAFNEIRSRVTRIGHCAGLGHGRKP